MDARGHFFTLTWHKWKAVCHQNELWHWGVVLLWEHMQQSDKTRKHLKQIRFVFVIFHQVLLKTTIKLKRLQRCPTRWRLVLLFISANDLFGWSEGEKHRQCFQDNLQEHFCVFGNSADPTFCCSFSWFNLVLFTHTWLVVELLRIMKNIDLKFNLQDCHLSADCDVFLIRHYYHSHLSVSLTDRFSYFGHWKVWKYYRADRTEKYQQTDGSSPAGAEVSFWSSGVPLCLTRDLISEEMKSKPPFQQFLWTVSGLFRSERDIRFFTD